MQHVLIQMAAMIVTANRDTMAMDLAVMVISNTFSKIFIINVLLRL